MARKGSKGKEGKQGQGRKTGHKAGKAGRVRGGQERGLLSCEKMFLCWYQFKLVVFPRMNLLRRNVDEFCAVHNRAKLGRTVHCGSNGWVTHA
jgi:hypothetical protein